MSMLRFGKLMNRSKKEKTWILSSLVLLFSISLSGTFGQSHSKLGHGAIKGIVTDPGDSRVAYARIIIKSNRSKQIIRANDAGEYELILPRGKYIIYAEMDGFHKSKSKKTLLISNEFVYLNFVLIGIRNDIDHP